MDSFSDLLALALVNSLIWAGIFVYMWRLHKRLKRLEREKDQ